MPVQQQRAREAGLSAGRAQRHQLVHGQHQLDVPLHHVSDCGVGMMLVRSLFACALAGILGSAYAQSSGQALFEAHCAPCHQNDGSGTVGLAPALTGAHWAVLGANSKYLPTVLLKGLAGRIEVNGQNFSGNMPSFAAQWDDTNLAAIAQYVRGLQGNTTVSNTPQEWADLRQSTGSPPQTRLMRLGLLGAK